MYVPFDRLPDEARVWIYATNRHLSDKEVIAIEQELIAFLTQWTAHQQALEASFSIPYNNFIVIGLNENKNLASGCSIDASVHFLKQLERKFKVDLKQRNTEFHMEAPIHMFLSKVTLRRRAARKRTSPK